MKDRPQSQTYVLVTAARDEAQFIERTIRSVVGQRVRPVKWIIVSDGSTDGTDDIVARHAAEHEWIELVRLPKRRRRHFAGKARAFNAGFARLQDLTYDFIGNVDADVSFDEQYFSLLLRKLAEDPALGVVGTRFKDRTLEYDYRFVSVEHVSGPCQLFRRACFENLGGYVPARLGGVDHIAVITARMKGWRTQTFMDTAFLHNRPMGSSEHGALGARFRSGTVDYSLGSHPVWEFSRAIYQTIKKPYVVGALMLLAGYVSARIRRMERPVSREFVEFHRREQMHRLRTLFAAWAAALMDGPEPRQARSVRAETAARFRTDIGS